MKRRVCVVTGSRAEYGLLYWLMKEIQAEPLLELQVIATGMHLSPEFGLTYRKIEEDGFQVDARVEMLLSSDTPVGIAKSIGMGVISCADALARLQPDIVVLLGDRFEIFAAAQAALTARIPVAHLHGGETTEGAIDEAFRHAITKMSHLHFTATEEYRARVVQLGENPERVFNVGAAGIDNINRLKLLGRSDLERALGFKLGKKNLLVTFHPVTLEDASAEKQFYELMAALDTLTDTHVIFTKPNADTDGRIIGLLIDEYVAKHHDTAAAYTSLGQLRYLSVMRIADGVVGNSSSGLVEAPSLKAAVVNIGDRQLGRVRASNVVDCAPAQESILKAIEKILSPEFRASLQYVVNPHGEGNVAEKIVAILKQFPLGGILKKSFYNYE